MNINRHNYEEFFIQYMDNELSKEQRREVEDFVQLHPDLKEELELLQQFKFTPDTHIVYNGKEELMKMGGQAPVSLTNYEEWFVQYIDEELTPEQKLSVEQFVAAHPTLQQELNLLQQTKLQPEEIVFADKASLYRHEEKVRVVYFNWKRVAAAVILLLGIGFGTYSVLNNKPGTEKNGQVAGTKEKKAGDNINTPLTVQEHGSMETNTSVAAENNDQQQKVINPATHNTKTSQQAVLQSNKIAKDQQVAIADNNKVNDNKTVIDPAMNNKKDDDVIALTAIKAPTNNLPSSEKNPNLTQTNTDIQNIASKELPKNVVRKDADVTKESAPSSDDYTYASNDGKKNKLRGFFRKVTRTFEKRTNINATEDDRLLVAGLAIKL